jgi:hypothetical protein
MGCFLAIIFIIIIWILDEKEEKRSRQKGIYTYQSDLPECLRNIHPTKFKHNRTKYYQSDTHSKMSIKVSISMHDEPHSSKANQHTRKDNHEF